MARGPAGQARGTGWVARGYELGAGPTESAGPDTESLGATQGPDTDPTQRGRERRSLTQRAAGARRGPTQGAPGPNTESAGRVPGLFSAGAILVNFILYIYTKKIYIYIKTSDCMSLDAGDSRCHGCSFFDGEKEWMTQKASVNCSYDHGLAFASHSVCFSKHACTIEILFVKCW